MNNEEYELFLNKTLNLVENAINFLNRSKHIVAYNKMLGVYQKLASLEGERRIELSLEELSCKSVSHYMLDGRYDDAITVIKKIKIDLCLVYDKVKKENEKNRNESV